MMLRPLLFLTLSLPHISAEEWSHIFAPNARWQTFAEVSSTNGKPLQVANPQGTTYLTNAPDWKGAPYLRTAKTYRDCQIEMEFLIPENSNSGVYLMGRYEVQILDSHGKKKVEFGDLGGIYQQWNDKAKPQGFGGTAPSKNAAKPAGEWQNMKIRFRAPRLDTAGGMIEKPIFLSVIINGEEVQKDIVVHGSTLAHPQQGIAAEDAVFIQGDHGAIALRKFIVTEEDFSKVSPKVGKKINNRLDLVHYGAETFQSLGCAECHSTIANDPSTKTGPSLYGMFQKDPRSRDIIEAAEQHRHTVKADTSYLERSIRDPHSELAIAETGATKAEAYLPVMPPYPVTVLDETQLTAIHHYLLTLNEPAQKGPDSVIVADPRADNTSDHYTDSTQVLVTDQTLAYRARIKGNSARAVFVGTPTGLNYTFDPINLSINRIWWGGFLDLTREMDGRANKNSSLGKEAKSIALKQPLLVPHHSETDQPIDLSFKSPLSDDFATIKKNLYSETDFSEQLVASGADFLGYTLAKEPGGQPSFHYQVGENSIDLTFQLDPSGKSILTLSGDLKSAQKFTLNLADIKEPIVSAGTLQASSWTLPPGKHQAATLSFKLPAAPENIWRPELRSPPLTRQTVSNLPAPNLQLPAGYEAMQIPPPLDRNGRPQLFEPLGMAFTKSGALIVTTRTAGVWRYEKNTWSQIAHGLLDSMGVIIENDEATRLIVGQKPELTRLIDHDGDGITDEYQTVSDDFLYTTNYHEYLHGPARGSDGNYYVTLNLPFADGPHVFKNGSRWMGSSGGYRGWAIKITPDGETTPFASGLRSPAGIASAPDGQIYYTDNQGSYFGTSKFLRLSEGKFYGNPAGLVDFPGMTPDSQEIKWDKVKSKVEPALALLPHSHLANSPGSPTWDTTGGAFGSFSNHIFLGDQTLSTLFRLIPHAVSDLEETAIIPFAKGFPSGVMRLCFSPDGNLYVGQTGRGWRSNGGSEAALVKLTYDAAKAASQLLNIQRDGDTYILHFTQALEKPITKNITIDSWTYIDSPKYGSPETDRKDETILESTTSADKKSITVTLAPSKSSGSRIVRFKLPDHPNDPVAYYTRR